MNFYVGQRVKKVRGSDNLGLEAVVVAVMGPHIRVRCCRAAIFYEPFGDVGRQASAGTEGNTQACNWEPILPEGMESIEEALKLWEPQGETA